MNLLYTSLVLLFLIPTDNVDDKIKQMCDCLTTAKNSGKKEDKGKCLTLQEKLVKEIGEKNEEAIMKFKMGTNQCMKELYAPKADAVGFDDQVKDVCSCVDNAGEDRRNRMKCMELQDIYARKYNEDTLKKQDFIKTTNDCLFK